MTAAMLSAEQHLQALRQDIGHFMRMTQDDFFNIDFRDIEEYQLSVLRERFADLRPRVRLLDKLASEVGVSAIEDWDDLALLAMPHTIYKGYLSSDVEHGRFSRLTRWLGTLTAHDLSGVDTTACQSLDEWMQRLESVTPLRPVTSSGTSGKISIFPRDVSEERPWASAIVNFLSPYGEESSVDFRSGNVPMICPWPFDKGRQSVPTLLGIVRRHLYGGRNDMVTTLRPDTMLVEEQWLAGKMRRAEIHGEELALTDRERRVLHALRERRKAATDLMPAFADRVVKEYRHKPIAFLSGWPQIYDFVMTCIKLGVKPAWARGSVFFVGGGNKGITLPEGWRQTVDAVLPASHYEFKEMYGMTETTCIAPRCRAGHYHPFPWGVFQVVDPDTSSPMPRRGVQVGRMMIYDLVPRAFWTGMLTGDEVTIYWDEKCACGRKGPYFDGHIQRYSEARGGDDKITCTKSPDAFEKLEQYALSDVY